LLKPSTDLQQTSYVDNNLIDVLPTDFTLNVLIVHAILNIHM